MVQFSPIMKHLIALFLSFLAFSALRAQTWQWAKGMGGTQPDEGKAITTDAGGNIYSTGRYYGNSDFDPGPGAYTLKPHPCCFAMYVQKLDSAGNFVWAKDISGDLVMHGTYATDVTPTGIAVDALGNIYITGTFRGCVDFDPGDDSNIVNTLWDGGYDAFVLKLTASGAFVWMKKLDGDGVQLANHIAVDKNSDVYIIGSFRDTADFDAGPQSMQLVANGLDGFLLKWNSDGDFLWVKQLKTTQDNVVLLGKVAVDINGDIVVGGHFTGEINIDKGSTYEKSAYSEGASDGFILKSDREGKTIWLRSEEKPVAEAITSLATDKEGNIFWAGVLNDTNYDATNHISKADSGYEFSWTQSFGLRETLTMAMTIDSQGDIWIAGSFWGSSDINPGPDEHMLSATGRRDMFIARFDNDGVLKWASSIGGRFMDAVTDMCFDASGAIYVTGSFMDTVEFITDSGERLAIVATGGLPDAFVAKLALPNKQVVTPAGCGLQIFPNPSEGSISVRTSEVPNAIVVTDAAGRKISAVQPQQTENLFSLLSPGVYFITAFFDGYICNEKFVVR